MIQDVDSNEKNTRISSEASVLTKENIVHMDLRGCPNVSAQEITDWVKKKARKDSVFLDTKSEPIGDLFLGAAKMYDINVWYLASHAMEESGWGTSNIAKTKFNFYGINVQDKNPSGGFRYVGVKGGIYGAADFLSKNYIHSSKHQQYTLHLMRYPKKETWHAYATNPSWATNIAAIMYNSPMNKSGVVDHGTEIRDSVPLASVERGSLYKMSFDGKDGTYDGPACKAVNTLHDKPSFVPPTYYEDDFSSLPHRYTQGDYFLRIGDSRFVVPPTQIHIDQQDDVRTYNSLRQKQSIKVPSGASVRTISMKLVFTDFNQVNGYEMHTANGHTSPYYMDGLNSLIAQMKTMPFLPVENEYLNLVHGIYAVALNDCSVNVVEGFPGMLEAELTMLEFDPEPFLYKPAWLYDNHFVWPLYRWHYQRLISGRTREQNVLAPFVGDGVLNFWYLDERALQGHKKEVIAESEKGLKEGDRYPTWWDFNSKLEKDINHNKLFQPFNMPPDYEIVDIRGSVSNRLTPLTSSLTNAPTFQFFGNHDARFNMVLKTSSRETIYLIKQLKDQMDRYLREYQNGFVSSMLRIENNFINMFGVTGVLFEKFSVSTVEGETGQFYISMDFISYDETQYKDEKLGHLDTVDFGEGLTRDAKKQTLALELEGGGKGVFDNHIRHAVNAEREMDKLELYPDLELPTPKELEDAIKSINIGRKKANLTNLPYERGWFPENANFVDPDFFFSYPKFEDLMDSIGKSLQKENVRKLAVEKGYGIDPDFDDIFGKIDFKQQFVDATRDAIRQHRDADFMKGFEGIIGVDPNTLDKDWSDTVDRMFNPTNYPKRFWTKSWSGDGGMWKEADTKVDRDSDSKWDRLYYDKQSARKTVKQLSANEQYEGMFHDMIRYDKRGTMMRAFPTYSFVIIDEGGQVNSFKLWDNYYTYHSISEISIHMDRKSPLQTAYVKLSNIYGALEDEGKYHHELTNPTLLGYFKDVGKELFGFTDIKQEDIFERTLIYESVKLLAGARIHIRMGYSATASELPVMFNGTIAEIDTGEVVTIVAQSFGSELTNEIPADPNENTSMFTEGAESTEMFRYYMSERKGNYVWQWRETGEPEKYQSTYGIDHFGFLAVRNDRSLWEGLPSLSFDKAERQNLEDYDVMKNIYSSVGQNKLSTDGSVSTQEGGEKKKTAKERLDSGDYETEEERLALMQESLKDIHDESLLDKAEKIGGSIMDALFRAKDAIKQYDKETEGNQYVQKPKWDIFGNAVDSVFGWFKDGAISGLDKLQSFKDGTDEENFAMRLDGKTPWDVFKTIEGISPEYIMYPHPHQFHYTLFFGKPSWDVQCGYILPPITGYDVEYGKKISDYYELTKPFSQIHFYSAYGDIIKNDIKVDGSNLTTAVLPVYSMKKEEQAKSYDIAWADYYIRGSFQKTKTVDTTLVQNMPMVPTWIEEVSSWAKGLFTETNYEKYGIRFGQGVIASSFRDMYQGELVVYGDPSVKPFDIFYMDDYNKKMTGVAEVGRVTHSLSIETGFITSIKPDLLVAQNPDPMKDSDTWNEEGTSSDQMGRVAVAMAKGSLEATRILSIFVILKGVNDSKGWSRLNSLYKMAKSSKTTASFGQQVKKVKQWTRDKAGKPILTDKITKYVKFGSPKLKIPGSAIKASGNLISKTVGRIPGWGGLISFAASSVLLQVIEHAFVQKYNNVIKIYPLYHQDRPFVAGINGHKMLIPGWQDNGSGKPVRVPYDNVKKIEPPAIKDLAFGFIGKLKEFLEGAGMGLAGPESGYLDATGQSNTPVAEYLKKIPEDQLKGPMFCCPIALGSEGKGYAGMKKRISSQPGGRKLSWEVSERDHKGVDYSRGAPSKKNDAIHAIAAGKVVFSGNYGGLGHYVMIRHEIPQGSNKTPYVFYSGYGHFTAASVRVQLNQTIPRGAYIGPMGNAGNSSGPHLHFEILVPKDANAALTISPGKPSLSFGHPGLKSESATSKFANPVVFIDSIVAFNSELIEYIPYKG